MENGSMARNGHQYKLYSISFKKMNYQDRLRYKLINEYMTVYVGFCIRLIYNLAYLVIQFKESLLCQTKNVSIFFNLSK